MDNDEARILRSIVPDKWKGATRSVGGVQAYISELELQNKLLTGEVEAARAWHDAYEIAENKGFRSAAIRALNVKERAAENYDVVRTIVESKRST